MEIDEMFKTHFQDQATVFYKGCSVNSSDKFLLINIDGFNTSKDYKDMFQGKNFVYYYEPDIQPGDVLTNAILPINEAIDKMNTKRVFYYPKNDECNDFFRTIPNVEFRKFSSYESLIVSYYYQKMANIYDSYFYLQMIQAFPNVDFNEIMANLNLPIKIYADTEPVLRLLESATRKEELKSLVPIVNFFDEFCSHISNRFEKYKSVGVIGVNKFSTKLIKILSSRMFVDVYDSEMDIEDVKKICPDATNNLKSLLKNCNSLLICKNYGLTQGDIDGKKVFDVCGAYKNQTNDIKCIGQRGWIYWPN